jgi:hypothetical protein
MRQYNVNDTIRLKEDARPVGTTTAELFKEQTKDGQYWGVPVEYFTIERDKVYLDNRLASKLRWTVDGVMPNMLNIAALPDAVQVDGEEVKVNPGFWCSNVSKENVL